MVNDEVEERVEVNEFEEQFSAMEDEGKESIECRVSSVES